MAFAAQSKAESKIREAIADLPMIRAISVGGSSASGLAGDESDIDMHVYWSAPLATRDERAARLMRCADSGSVRLDVRSFGLEDWLWVDGRKVELVYLYLPDLEAEIERAYGPGLDGDSLTTALLYIVAAGRKCYDRDGIWQAMHDRLNAAYPEPTRRALLEHRPPLLRIAVDDIRKAQRRGDLLYVETLRGTLQSLYFNLLFALNRRYHPGGKRLLLHAARCPLRPPDLEARWNRFVLLGAGDAELPAQAETLIAELLELLEQNGVALRSEVW